MILVQDMILADKYRVLQRLGEGGYGATFLAEDTSLARQCVIKAPTRLGDDDLVQFTQEGQLLASLARPPHLPVVYELLHVDGFPCLIMEYIDGETLDRKVKDRSTPFDIPVVLRWGDELLNAIRKIVAGRKYISPTLAETLVLELDMDRDKPPHEYLSDREYEVLCMIASGNTVKEIAEELGLSIKTVSTYRSRLLIKMHLSNNAQLTHYAIENGLV